MQSREQKQKHNPSKKPRDRIGDSDTAIIRYGSTTMRCDAMRHGAVQCNAARRAKCCRAERNMGKWGCNMGFCTGLEERIEGGKGTVWQAVYFTDVPIITEYA